MSRQEEIATRMTSYFSSLFGERKMIYGNVVYVNDKNCHKVMFESSILNGLVHCENIGYHNDIYFQESRYSRSVSVETASRFVVTVQSGDKRIKLVSTQQVHDFNLLTCETTRYAKGELRPIPRPRVNGVNPDTVIIFGNLRKAKRYPGQPFNSPTHTGGEWMIVSDSLKRLIIATASGKIKIGDNLEKTTRLMPSSYLKTVLPLHDNGLPLDQEALNSLFLNQRFDEIGMKWCHDYVAFIYIVLFGVIPSTDNVPNRRVSDSWKGDLPPASLKWHISPNFVERLFEIVPDIALTEDELFQIQDSVCERSIEELIGEMDVPITHIESATENIHEPAKVATVDISNMNFPPLTFATQSWADHILGEE